MKERIQKILAQAGVASRRKCEQLIAQGRVTVNGKVATLGESADASKDKITVDGKPIVLQKKVYIMLNKPKGYVTTVSEQHGMRTVMNLVKVPQRVFPVGRLDKYTEGLLLLTNDGEFANKLTHPRYEVKKEYFVVLNKKISDAKIERLQKGVVIDNKAVKVDVLEAEGRQMLISIHEGRKHIVKLIFEKLGFSVVKLVRTRIGKLGFGDLKPGKWRFLTEKELKKLTST